MFSDALTYSVWYKLGTLGEARGKLTLIQRFDYDLLPSHLTQRIGIHLGPTQWTVNGKEIKHIYNAEDGQVAYIQVSFENFILYNPYTY